MRGDWKGGASRLVVPTFFINSSPNPSSHFINPRRGGAKKREHKKHPKSRVLNPPGTHHHHPVPLFTPYLQALSITAT